MAVLIGLDLLLNEGGRKIRGRKAALLANSSCVSSHLQDGVQALASLPGVDLVRLIAPEHGFRGIEQDMVPVDEHCDPITGLPIVSLYGGDAGSLVPRPDHLEGVELLVVDLQDVGARYYTFGASMVMAMEVCAKAGVAVMVLDRPNPLGGVVEGRGVEEGFGSFVGYMDVPTRHGLTLGEIARLSQRHLDLDLEILAVQGWNRRMLFHDTGLPWVMPSPNMPSWDTALVYPGLCLLEGTNLSEGRGTTRPFEIFGAPFLEAGRLCRALESLGLAGVTFRPLCFRPTFQKHAGKACHGAQVHVTDPRRFEPLRTGIAVVHTIFCLWPDQAAWRREVYEFVSDRPAIDLLAGGAWLREAIEGGAPLGEIFETLRPYEERFLAERKACLIEEYGSQELMDVS